MAIEFEKVSRFNDTVVEHGWTTRQLSRVRVTSVLKGLDDTHGSYTQARNFIQLNLNQQDPYLGLPRQRTHIRKLSGGFAIAITDYYLRSSGGDEGVTDFTLARVRSSVVNVDWYSTFKSFNSANYPSTTTWADNFGRQRVYHPVVVWDVGGRLLLTTTPLTVGVRGLVNKINNAAFSLAGISWPSETILFTAATVDADRIGPNTVYDTTYWFRIREDKHYQEYVDTSFQINAAAQYTSSTFSGVFPTT